MSGPDDLLPDNEDAMIRAGEYALGLLEGTELADARREFMAGGAFAHAVAWWERYFSGLSEQAGEVEPSPAVWPAVLARLQNEGGGAVTLADTRNQSAGLSGWRLGLAMAGVAAAAAIVALLFDGSDRSVVSRSVDPAPPIAEASAPPVAKPAGPQLIAQLSDAEGERSVAARIDPETGVLRVLVAGLEPEDAQVRSAELWVVPEGGQPLSLGLIPGDGRVERDLTVREKALLVAGATMAVTFEDREGAPHNAPTGDILVAAPLAEI